MNTQRLCDALEACLQSADAAAGAGDAGPCGDGWGGSMSMSLRGRRSSVRSNPLLSAGCFVVSLLATTCIALCDALDGRLQSADAKRERGRLVESMLARVS